MTFSTQPSTDRSLAPQGEGATKPPAAARCPFHGAQQGSSFVAEAQEAFRAAVLAEPFPCVAAKAAVNTRAYRLEAYPALGAVAAPALAADLRRFLDDPPREGSGFSSFVAAFQGPALSELEFEAALWELLAALRLLDTAPHADVSSDTASPDFGFSFAGQAWFLVGLHPQSSRLARRLPFSAIAFNLHRQFRALKAAGRWPRLQQVIRQRDIALQGSINPNLADYGSASEARQYSGRAVEADWQAPKLPPISLTCPFKENRDDT